MATPRRPKNKHQPRGKRPRQASARAARAENGLTPKQQKFVDAMLEGVTQKQAADRAGYTPQHAVRLMQNPAVIEALRTGQKALADAGICDKVDLMRELWRIGKLDPRRLFADGGALLAPKDWPDEVAAAVASLDVQETFEGEGKNRRWTGYLKKIRFHPKVQSIEVLGRMLGAYAAEKAPVGPDGKPIPSRRTVVLVPMKRTEADMEGYGSQAQAAAARAAGAVPEANDAPTPKQTALDGLRKLARKKQAQE